jgi:GntR family transcriptional regulator
MTSHSASLFSIATGSSEPIYRQLIEQTRRLAAAGVLSAGDVLPSVRDVALTLAVNPMTVSKAYNMLETEGLLSRSRGVGMLVAERRAQRIACTNAKTCCGPRWNGPPRKRANSNSIPTP